jgi:hypothetical protein
MLPSSHPPLAASQQKRERKLAESQIPAREKWRVLAQKLQNVVTDSTASFQAQQVWKGKGKSLTLGEYVIRA